MGFVWGSRVQWPTVTMSEFFLGGVISYVDPMGGKERIRIPINSTEDSSLEALKRLIIEYTGSKADSEKRGLGSPIEIKLC